MKKQSTFSLLSSLVFSMLGYALILGGVGAILSDLFTWNLALSIGGSDIAIPADMYVGFFFIILGATIAALHHFWTPIYESIKKYSLIIMLIFVVIIIAIVYGGKQFIMYMDGGPAITAAMNNDTETLNELFEKNEVKSEDRDAMMMWVSQKGHTESLQILISNGLNPNATRGDGLTALEAACAWGGEKTVKILKEAGATGKCSESP
jgi:hypothetical protein